MERKQLIEQPTRIESIPNPIALQFTKAENALGIWVEIPSSTTREQLANLVAATDYNLGEIVHPHRFTEKPKSYNFPVLTLIQNFHRQVLLVKAIGVVEQHLIKRLTSENEFLAGLTTEEAITRIQQSLAYKTSLKDIFGLMPQYVMTIFHEAQVHFKYDDTTEFPEELKPILQYVADENPLLKDSYTLAEAVDIAAFFPATFTKTLAGILAENASLTSNLLHRIFGLLPEDIPPFKKLELILNSKEQLKNLFWQRLRKGPNGFIAGAILHSDGKPFDVTLHDSYFEIDLNDEAKREKFDDMSASREDWNQIVAIAKVIAEHIPEAQFAIPSRGLHALFPQSSCPVQKRALYDSLLELHFHLIEAFLNYQDAR